MTAPIRSRTLAVAAALVVACLTAALEAHGVSGKNATFVQSIQGPAIGPFLYLGAKHMVTGYDHLMFLVGVIFFLYRAKDVVQYVSLFTLGHSITLLAGVLGGIRANANIVDAIIGASVVYKAFENLGGFERLLGFRPNTKAAVLVFGLFHGFGLATKLQEFSLTSNGLVTNIISFNVGVEIGPDSRARIGASRAHGLAPSRQLHASRLCHEHRADGGRVHARRISARRLRGVMARAASTAYRAVQSETPRSRPVSKSCSARSWRCSRRRACWCSWSSRPNTASTCTGLGAALGLTELASVRPGVGGAPDDRTQDRQRGVRARSLPVHRIQVPARKGREHGVFLARNRSGDGRTPQRA
jgi:hypothetical protein